jgi:hypothetical protein
VLALLVRAVSRYSAALVVVPQRQSEAPAYSQPEADLVGIT